MGPGGLATAHVGHPGLETVAEPFLIVFVTGRGHRRRDPDSIEAQPGGLGLQSNREVVSHQFARSASELATPRFS